MPVTGIAMGYFGGKGLPFFTQTLAATEDGKARNGEVAKQAFSIHKTVGTYGKFLVPLHVAGTGYHVIRGDAIFSRIVPGL